jgi:hypothetical protein
MTRHHPSVRSRLRVSSTYESTRTSLLLASQDLSKVSVPLLAPELTAGNHGLPIPAPPFAEEPQVTADITVDKPPLVVPTTFRAGLSTSFNVVVDDAYATANPRVRTSLTINSDGDYVVDLWPVTLPTVGYQWSNYTTGLKRITVHLETISGKRNPSIARAARPFSLVDATIITPPEGVEVTVVGIFDSKNLRAPYGNGKSRRKHERVSPKSPPAFPVTKVFTDTFIDSVSPPPHRGVFSDITKLVTISEENACEAARVLRQFKESRPDDVTFRVGPDGQLSVFMLRDVTK